MASTRVSLWQLGPCLEFRQMMDHLWRHNCLETKHYLLPDFGLSSGKKLFIISVGFVAFEITWNGFVGLSLR